MRWMTVFAAVSVAACGGQSGDNSPGEGGLRVRRGECRKTGCSSHLCADRELASTCEWTEAYACYQQATCERQADGQCGFTVDEELTACLKRANNPPPVDPCSRLTCDAGFECVLQDVVCIQAPCDPVPVCQPVRPAECKKTGCSGQLCSDQELASTCEWRPEYGCYRQATCERQADGQCGFTMDSELKACLEAVQQPVNPCTRMLCAPGTRCVLQDVVCIRAPCNPIAVCEPIPDPCASVTCEVGHECVLQDVVCIQAPCDPVPVCQPVRR